MNGSAGKESTCNAGDTGDMGSIPGSGWSPGRRHGNPLQYSCLESPMDREAWQVSVQRVTKESDTTEWLSTHKRWIALNKWVQQIGIRVRGFQNSHVRVQKTCRQRKHETLAKFKLTQYGRSWGREWEWEMVYRYYSIRSRRVDGMVDWGYLNQKQTSKEKKKELYKTSWECGTSYLRL